VVAATTSAAGLVCQPPHIDVNKVDVQVSTWGQWNGRVRTIGLQLKATSAPTFIGQDGNRKLSFPLDGADYNAFLEPSTVPTFLVVVCLPDLEGCWVRHRPHMTALSAGAWWLRVGGDPTTQGSINVHLPVEQRFDVAALRSMLEVA
jgi:Domain of unknown function (DUF4365)